MANAYRIIGWEDTFENNRSRTVKELRWCLIPNRFDGDKISELIEIGGDSIYGAWVAFCLICSRSSERGTAMKSSGMPHTPKSMSRISGISEKSFKKMLEIATLPQVALLEVFALDCQETDTQLTPDCQSPDEGRKGMEGREGREDTASSDAEPKPFYISKKGRKLEGRRLESFERFWLAFDYKRGKTDAADSWLDIPELTNALVDRICESAELEAQSRDKSDKSPKWAQGWITGRRWEDEALSGRKQAPVSIPEPPNWRERGFTLWPQKGSEYWSKRATWPEMIANGCARELEREFAVRG